MLCLHYFIKYDCGVTTRVTLMEGGNLATLLREASAVSNYIKNNRIEMCPCVFKFCFAKFYTKKYTVNNKIIFFKSFIRYLMIFGVSNKYVTSYKVCPANSWSCNDANDVTALLRIPDKMNVNWKYTTTENKLFVCFIYYIPILHYYTT